MVGAMRWSVLVGGLLMACNDGGEAGDDSGLPEPAPLATVSGGACPDLSTPGSKRITSNGQQRRFEIFFPEDRPADMPVIFSWHGLSTADFDPVGGMVDGFDLDELAEQEQAVVVVPEALGLSLLGMDVLLWGILGNEFEEHDLALYDDLRTCIAEQLDVDLRRVASWGHSGGGLWTSFLLMHRSDTLAAGVSSSGGVDLTIPLLGDRLPYTTPDVAVPAMLMSGGETDVWPDMSLPVIVFDESTDALAGGLAGDGSLVVRCQHDLGHQYLPNWFWPEAVDWMLDHTYGAPSPWASGERDPDPACVVEAATE